MGGEQPIWGYGDGGMTRWLQLHEADTSCVRASDVGRGSRGEEMVDC